MSESQVMALLGNPTDIETIETQAQGMFSPDSECRPLVVRALVYERWIRDDVFFGIDARGQVVCKNSGAFMKER